MSSIVGSVAFFDIGDTLASVVLSANRSQIARLIIYDYIVPVLTELRNEGVRLGIISNRGNIPEENVIQALANAGILENFERALIIFGPKDSPRIFEEAARLASRPDLEEKILFVGEDASEREQAVRANFLVSPHPRLALSALQQDSGLRYLRINVSKKDINSDWQSALQKMPLVPVYVSGEPKATVYAIANEETAAQLDDLGFFVDRLGTKDEPLTTNLYILRDDYKNSSDFLSPIGNAAEIFASPSESSRILASTQEGLFVCLPANKSVEDYHFKQAEHGHNLKLIPSLSLLSSTDALLKTRFSDVEEVSLFSSSEALSNLAVVDANEKELLSTVITPEKIMGFIKRYTGVEPIDDNGTVINSRHIHNPQNSTAVTTLISDLERIGAESFRISRHTFTHEGRVLDNVEAEMEGSGLSGIVLLGAHLDSTGARQAGYRATTDPAPGADDDASGMAGVLASAEVIKSLDSLLKLPRRAIRFVFFNAEEHGLVGSHTYARAQSSLNAQIVAVLQMDMMGYDVLEDRTFELHAGFSPSSLVQQRSLALAQTIAALVPQVSPSLPSPQIYPDTQPDPAESRSDHYSFQLEGYAGCLISEDFFVGPKTNSPPPEPNPRYHLPSDKTINALYTADIARVVAAAAWVLATR